MKKAREEAEFKKRMTERSDFSASVGIKKAKKKLKEGARPVPANQFNMGVENTKQTGFGKVDGAQIQVPRKATKVPVGERIPLHYPKLARKFKKATIEGLESFDRPPIKKVVRRRKEERAAYKPPILSPPQYLGERRPVLQNRADTQSLQIEEEEPSNIEIPATLNNQDEEAPEVGNQDINPP